MIDEAASTPATFKAGVLRGWSAAQTLFALTTLIYGGWNCGPAPQFHLPQVDLTGALSYALLACVVRYAMGGRRLRADEQRSLD